MDVPYVAGSDTSQGAAVSVAPFVPSMRTRVLDLIRSAPDGLTCSDVEHWTGFRHQTASARLCDLRSRQLIVDSGRRRPSASGRPSTVWVAAA